MVRKTLRGLLGRERNAFYESHRQRRNIPHADKATQRDRKARALAVVCRRGYRVGKSTSPSKLIQLQRNLRRRCIVIGHQLLNVAYARHPSQIEHIQFFREPRDRLMPRIVKR